jgi:hypothetical protein
MEDSYMAKARLLAMTLLVVLAAPLVMADDLTGANKLLCTAVQATSCNDDGDDCVTDLPWNFNVPQFIEVDLAGKMLRTTKSADEARQSPINSLTRADGVIVLQGLELGRAYSFVVNEKTGRLSAAVARDGVTVAVFGACTPMPSSK